MGCYVIGLAGGPDKCRFLVEELGLDGAIDYKAGKVGSRLKAHFPDGVDVYFDNVGGPILDLVLGNMAPGCRIALCGAIAQYDRQDESQFHGARNLPMLVFKQARIEGYVAGQLGEEKNRQALDHLLALYGKGQLKVRTQEVGFREMPDALLLLLEGRNQGKLIARVE
jgi:NADPH-dependent curcumin reductase CurA